MLPTSTSWTKATTMTFQSLAYVALDCNLIKVSRGFVLVDQAMEMAQVHGGFTIFALVDALTRLSQNIRYAGDRTELDSRIGSLLGLAV